MSATRRSSKGTPKPRRQAPSYLMPPLALSESDRVQLAHQLWEARRTMLLVAPMVVTMQTRILNAAKVATVVADVLLPEPPRDV